MTINPVWPFTEQPDKPNSNEGNHIASYDDPVWSLDPSTGVPITPTHAPCGYWTKGYLQPLYFTSRPYPVIDEEQTGLISIALTKAVSAWKTDFDDSSELNSIELTAGVFNGVITHDYVDWPIEETELNSIELTAGVFRTYITHDYVDWPIEETELTGVGLTEGIFRVAMVNYTYWPLEETELTGVSLTEGVHGTA